MTVELLRLFADELRWQLVAELGRSDRRVGELATLLGRGQSLVSYHLRELRSAGVVTSRRSAADGRDTYYRLDVECCRAVLQAAAEGLHPILRLVQAPDERLPTHARSVLFLCTGNSARSQMARALVEARSGGVVTARSAGSHPKAVHPAAVQVMAERGIDLSAATTTHLDDVTRARFDRVVTLCDRVREVCPEWPGTTVREHWSMPDPSTADEALPAMRAAADEIEVRIAYLLARLAADETDPRRSHVSNR